MSAAEWVDTYGIPHRRILWSNYRKLTWVGFEPTTTEFVLILSRFILSSDNDNLIIQDFKESLPVRCLPNPCLKELIFEVSQ